MNHDTLWVQTVDSRVPEVLEALEVCEDLQRFGDQVAEFGHKYFCPDYVSKNGMSVMECNKILLPNSLDSQVMIVKLLHHQVSQSVDYTAWIL